MIIHCTRICGSTDAACVAHLGRNGKVPLNMSLNLVRKGAVFFIFRILGLCKFCSFLGGCEKIDF